MTRHHTYVFGLVKQANRGQTDMIQKYSGPKVALCMYRYYLCKKSMQLTILIKKQIVNKVTSFIEPSLRQLKRKFCRKYSLYDVSTPAGKSQCTAVDWFPGRPFICSAQRVKYVMVQNGVGRTLKPTKCLFRSEIHSVSSRKP